MLTDRTLELGLLKPFVTVSECREPDAEVDALMRRLLNVGAPAFPIHFLTHVETGDGAQELACYIHATDCGDIVLTGGACTDNRLLRRLPLAQRQLLRQVGGIYRYTIMHMQRVLRDRFAALFACCGNKAAERIMLNTDAERAGPDELFVCWLHDTSHKQREQMKAKARSFMPF
mgnify:CR=1 FL=1